VWDLVLNEDQAIIAQSVREYLASEAPLERLRPNAGPRDFAPVCAGMIELGWFGLGLPEAVGGAGLGLSEEVLIQRECGRHLVSPSILATVLSAHAAVEAGDATLARALVTGELSAAIALIVTSSQSGKGRTAYAFDWSARDLLVAWADGGMGLFDAQFFADARLDAGLDDSVRILVGTMDVSQPRYWSAAATAPVPLRAQVLLAARLVGLAEQACDLTVEYAKVRQQFGKPIGSFQAVKHRCADMVVRARLAWHETALASLKVQAAAHDAPLHAAAAKLMAARAAHENARAAIQLHGAIGFQSECDVHWFMKRAHLYEEIGGGMSVQARRVAAEPSPLWQ
jgi:alkylation response protein AidB-like acyl-CoA dehydrogenase